MEWALGLFDPSGFPPRWSCGKWSEGLGWTHIIADVATFAAYVAIPLSIVWLNRRRALPLPRIGWLFAAFVLACGVTHLIEAIIFWVPVYRLSGLSKAITATVSWVTVVAIVRETPRLMALPAFEDLFDRLSAEQKGRSTAEAELRGLAEVIAASSEAVVGLGPDGRIQSWNRTANETFAIPAGEALGRPLAALVGGKDKERLTEWLGQTDEAGSLDLRVLAETGVRELELRFVAADAGPLSGAVFARDVTDRNAARRDLEQANLRLNDANAALERRVEERTRELERKNAELRAEVEERRATEARLSEAQALARLGSWSYELGAETIAWSNSMYELFGRPVGSPVLVEGHLEGLFVPEDAARLEAAAKATLEGGVPYDLRVRTRDDVGPARVLLARTGVRFGPDRSVLGLQGTIFDITEQAAQAEALAAANARLEAAVDDATKDLQMAVTKLESANGELESFIHMASHDMQEPLRTVRSFAQLLVEDLDGELPVDAAQDLRFIESAAARMQRMIDALLDLSRTSRSEPCYDAVELSALVAGVLVDFEAQVKDHGAQIETGPLPAVRSDPALLERIVSNLIGNALKFGGPNPRVRIAMGADGALEVEDSGPGIPPEKVERAFQPFKRLVRDVPGTGMGLTICKKAVERLGGRIEVDQGSLGGARFRVILPQGGPR